MQKIVDFFKKYWPTFFVIIALILLYAFLANKGLIDPFLFPSTDKIIESFGENWQTMIINMLASFKLLFPSLAVAVIIALIIGVPLGLNRKARDVFLPLVYAFSVVPSILLAPFLLILAPTLEWAARIMIIYSVMWPTTFGVINGIATIDKNYLDTADTLEIRGFERLFKVILPAASPTILTGFVNSLRGSFTILVFAEMYGAEHGMGFFVKRNSDFGLYQNVWSGFIFLVLVLVVVLRIFETIKDRLLSWTMD